MSRHWVTRRGARLAGLLACGVALLLIPACDGELIAKSPTAQFRDDLVPVFGDALGRDMAEAWTSTLDRMAEAEAAIADQDFIAYHAAVMATRTSMKTSVDETIRLLEADEAWRRKVFADMVAGAGQNDGAAGQDGEGKAAEIAGIFPDFGEPDQAWMGRGMAEHPRLAGEMLRAFIDLNAEVVRLGGYLIGAMGEEAMKAASEAMEGFKNPR